jgi:hypothetical protein
VELLHGHLGLFRGQAVQIVAVQESDGDGAGFARPESVALHLRVGLPGGNPLCPNRGGTPAEQEKGKRHAQAGQDGRFQGLESASGVQVSVSCQVGRVHDVLSF